jgi:hypothetical protein
MIEIFRIIVLIAFFATGLWLLNNVRVGLLSGKIRHSDSTSVAIKSKTPVKFWLIVAGQVLIALMLCTISVIMLSELI